MMYDCLIVGHNVMNFNNYESTIRETGVNNEAYRDLMFSFIMVQNQPYTFSDMYNEFISANNCDKISFGKTLSNTIAYLISYGSKRGFTFDFVQNYQYEKELLLDKLKKNEYKTIAITTTLYVSHLPIIEIMNHIKDFKKNAKVIIGGPYIFNICMLQEKSVQDYLFAYISADIYVNSVQGECTLLNIINAIKNGCCFENINNIIYRCDGGYKYTSLVEENVKLSPNMIDWSYFKEYDLKHVAIRTCISCAFNCSFCAFPKHAGDFQSVSIERIEYELDALKAIDKTKSIHFIDDTFNIPERRFKNLLKKMIEKKYDFKWHAYIRSQYIDKESAELMKRSGAEGVFLGVESGSQEILDLMNKRAKINDVENGIMHLKENGITTFASFIIGFPGETEKTIKATYDFIQRTKPDFYRIQLWYCDKLTDIYSRKEDFNLKGSQFTWSHNTMDSKTSMEWIEKLFMMITESVWIPQYDFDFDSIFYLTNNGINIDEVKNLLRIFNYGIKMNLKSDFDSVNLLNKLREYKIEKQRGYI